MRTESAFSENRTARRKEGGVDTRALQTNEKRRWVREGKSMEKEKERKMKRK